MSTSRLAVIKGELSLGSFATRDGALTAAYAHAMEQGARHVLIDALADDLACFTLTAFLNAQENVPLLVLRAERTQPKQKELKQTRRGAPTKLPGWAQCIGATIFPAALGLEAEGAPKLKLDRRARGVEYFICESNSARWLGSSMQLEQQGIKENRAEYLAERERERTPIGAYLCWAEYGKPLRAVYRRS